MIQASELAILSHSRTIGVRRRGSYIILQDWPVRGKRGVRRRSSCRRGNWGRSDRRLVIMSHLSKGSSFWAWMSVCLIAGELAKISCHEWWSNVNQRNGSDGRRVTVSRKRGDLVLQVCSKLVAQLAEWTEKSCCLGKREARKDVCSERCAC